MSFMRSFAFLKNENVRCPFQNIWNSELSPINGIIRDDDYLFAWISSHTWRELTTWITCAVGMRRNNWHPAESKWRMLSQWDGTNPFSAGMTRSTNEDFIIPRIVGCLLTTRLCSPMCRLWTNFVFRRIRHLARRKLSASAINLCRHF